MAKMIEKWILRFRMARLSRLRSQKNLIESFLPIRLAAIERRLSQRMAFAEMRRESKIADLATAAGTPTPTTVVLREAELARIEERFRWKQKALVQTRKRARKKHPDSPEYVARFAADEEKLLQAKQGEMTRISKKYRPAADSETALRQWNEINNLAASAYETKVRTLRESVDARIGVIRSKVEKQIISLNTKIESLRQTILLRHPAPIGEANLPEGVLLRLKNLSMRFGGLLAVDNLSFDVKQGEIFGLIGPNGAGKTTIFNCITRFYRATSGEMFYRRNSVEVIRLNDYPVHQIIRQGIVRTFQNVELVWELTILENLLVAAHTVYRSGFFAQLFHTPGLRREEGVLRAKALAVLQTLGLAGYAGAYPYGLPYGILKKIELARTLMANPRLIILDEPAAGLNDKETEELAHLIRRIRDEYHCTIFLVEHDMGLVMDICDTVCAISFGKMLAIGTPAEIQANRLVRGAYLGEQS